MQATGISIDAGAGRRLLAVVIAALAVLGVSVTAHPAFVATVDRAFDALVAPSSAGSSLVAASGMATTGSRGPSVPVGLQGTVARDLATSRLAPVYGPGGAITVAAGATARWTLAPTGSGRDALQPFDQGTPVASGARQVSDLGSLVAWYQMGDRGIEQGFTIAQRPAGTSRDVVVAMASSGGFSLATVGSDGMSVYDGHGVEVLRYGGLQVSDATGRTLPAHLVVTGPGATGPGTANSGTTNSGATGQQVRIVFDDHQATYPVTVDPWIQAAALVAPSDAGQFGYSVSLSDDGHTALVGDPFGNGGSGGAATVYTESAGTWSAGTPLPAPDGSANFGYAVALSGDGTTALVGDDQTSAGGAATVYTESAGTWSVGTPLPLPDGSVAFGGAVSLSDDGHTALVGDPAGNGGAGGAVTVYTESGSTWSFSASLLSPPDAFQFGYSVALSGDGGTALVGDPAGNGGAGGAATVFVDSGGSWNGGTSLLAPTGSLGFGYATALSDDGTVALVGDPGAGGTGQATVFTGGGSTWDTGTALDVPADAGYAGGAVALSDDGMTALVGAPWGNGGGSTLAYTENAGSWSSSTLLDPPSDAGFFGWSVALSANGLTALVGDNLGGSHGEATVFTTSGPAARFVVTAPPTATAGMAFSYSVTAVDRYGNVATDYTGTVAWTSSDAQATLPAPTTLTDGAGTFTATLGTSGAQTITGMDSEDPSITGTSGPIVVAGSVTAGDRLAAQPTGAGYWIVGPDGGVVPYGAAQPYGSMAGHPLNQPVTGAASTPSGHGYWLVAADGGVFAFGDAGFYGSMGSTSLNEPIVDVVPTADGRGYWLVASDGGVFSFGDAQFWGSTGSWVLNQPIADIAATPSGQGYWLVGADGGVFAFGDAGFYGSLGGMPSDPPFLGLFTTDGGEGYTVVDGRGTPTHFGS